MTCFKIYVNHVEDGRKHESNCIYIYIYIYIYVIFWQFGGLFPMSDFSVILVFMALFVASMVSFSFMIRSVHYYKSMLTLYA